MKKQSIGIYFFNIILESFLSIRIVFLVYIFRRVLIFPRNVNIMIINKINDMGMPRPPGSVRDHSKDGSNGEVAKQVYAAD